MGDRDQLRREDGNCAVKDDTMRKGTSLQVRFPPGGIPKHVPVTPRHLGMALRKFSVRCQRGSGAAARREGPALLLLRVRRQGLRGRGAETQETLAEVSRRN